MSKEVFHNLNQFLTSSNVYIKNVNIEDLPKRSCEFPTNGEKSFVMLCNHRENNNKKYAHRYGEFDNMFELDIDNMQIKNINMQIKHGAHISQQSKLTFVDNNYFGVVGDGTTDKCDNKIDYKITVIDRDENFSSITVLVKPPMRYQTYKVVEKNGDYFMKINGEIYRYSKLFSLTATILYIDGDASISGEIPHIMYLTDLNSNVKIISIENNSVIINTGLKEKCLKFPLNDGAKIVNIKFKKVEQTNRLQNVTDYHLMNVDEFDTAEPFLVDSVLEKVYESYFSLPVSKLPVEFIHPENKLLFQMACSKTVCVDRPFILGSQLHDFPNSSKDSLAFFNKNKEDYTLYPFHINAGKSNDSPTTLVKHHDKYLIYQRGNPVSGARIIEYSTSYDMKNWSKLKPINIPNLDISHENYYSPNIFSLKNTDYLIGFTSYYTKKRIEQQFHRLIISDDGVNFNVIGNINNMPYNVDHHEYLIVMDGIVIDENKTRIYFSDSEKLYEYTTVPYGLFYLESDTIGTVTTKMMKVFNNVVHFGYEGKITFLIYDMFDNFIDKCSFENNQYGVNSFTFNTNVDYVHLHIELQGKLYWIDGKFINNDKVAFSHLLYRVNDHMETWFDKAGENYHNIDIEKLFGYKAVSTSEITYNKSNTKAFITVILTNGERKELLLWNSDDDIMVKLGEQIRPFLLSNIDKNNEMKNKLNTSIGYRQVINEIIKITMNGEDKTLFEKDICYPAIYKRSICIFDYKLKDIPKC